MVIIYLGQTMIKL